MATEEEYFIAADLTLYANPLNSALRFKRQETNETTKKETTSNLPRKSEEVEPVCHTNEQCNADSDEVIASDMTKYDSPLAKFDVIHTERLEKEAQRSESTPESKE